MKGTIRKRGATWHTRIYVDGVRIEQTAGTSDRARALELLELRSRALGCSDQELNSAVALIEAFIAANQARERWSGKVYKLRRLVRRFNHARTIQRRHNRQIEEATK